MARVVDVQQTRVLTFEPPAEPPQKTFAEVLVVGGGLGGVAAALAACEGGRTVILVEETDWLGGQATSQGVSALDENAHIETSGGTRTYGAFRTAIRDWYRRNARLRANVDPQRPFNPGNGWVSRLCFEPRAALEVIDAMLAGCIASGHLRVMLRQKPYALEVRDGRVRHVDFVDLDEKTTQRISAALVIDASELGDLLALGAAKFNVGADARADFNEPSAPDEGDPLDVQSFTYPFVIEHAPGGEYRIAKPPRYEHNRGEQPYTLVVHYHDRGDLKYGMFVKGQGVGPFWTYRRLIDAGQFDDPKYPRDLSMINWPGNDYRDGSITVDSPEEVVRQLQAAKDLSLGLLYWLQNECERDDGGVGYPEFKLRPDVLGTADGLSKFPYIRESRRLVAEKIIVEQDVIVGPNRGPRAVHFPDSVGIGHYAIDIHESRRSRKQILSRTLPFQIPLGALIPRETSNLLAGAKNIGVTHITNGCYRLHPIEWAIGEAAGTTAALCIERQVSPSQVRRTPELLRELQRRLVARGVPIMWYDDVTPADDHFQRVQLLPFERPAVLETLKDLHAPKQGP